MWQLVSQESEATAQRTQPACYRPECTPASCSSGTCSTSPPGCARAEAGDAPPPAPVPRTGRRVEQSATPDPREATAVPLVGRRGVAHASQQPPLLSSAVSVANPPRPAPSARTCPWCVAPPQAGLRTCKNLPAQPLDGTPALLLSRVRTRLPPPAHPLRPRHSQTARISVRSNGSDTVIHTNCNQMQATSQ